MLDQQTKLQNNKLAYSLFGCAIICITSAAIFSCIMISSIVEVVDVRTDSTLNTAVDNEPMELVRPIPTKQHLDLLLISDLNDARKDTTAVNNEVIDMLGGIVGLPFSLDDETRADAIIIRDRFIVSLAESQRQYDIDSTTILSNRTHLEIVRSIMNDIISKTLKIEALNRLINI